MNEDIVRDGTGESMLRVARRSQPGGETPRRARKRRDERGPVGPAEAAEGVETEPATNGTLLRVLPGGRGQGTATSAPVTREEVAKTLRAARRRKQATIEEAAENTRLPRRALAAFEGHGGEEELPEPPYDRYFLREYARYLGVEDEPLLAAFDTAPDGMAELPLDYLPVERRPRRWPIWLLAIGSAAALITLAVARQGSHDAPALLSSGGIPQATQAPPQGVPPAAEPTTNAPPAFHGISAVLRLSENCWIRATVDGRQVMSETVQAGKTVRLTAKRTLVLRLGNGAAVRLTVNGKRFATGRAGEVVDLSFAWSRGRLTKS